MSKKVDKATNIKVTMRFNPGIGGGNIKDYHQMRKRCGEISKIFARHKIHLPISFGNPYAYGYRKVKTFTFEVDQKVWLKNKLKALRKALEGCRRNKTIGLKEFKIQRVRQTITTERLFESL